MRKTCTDVESIAAVSKLYSVALYLRIMYCDASGDIQDKSTRETYEIFMYQQRNLVRLYRMPRKTFAYACELGSCYAKQYSDERRKQDAKNTSNANTVLHP